MQLPPMKQQPKQQAPQPTASAQPAQQPQPSAPAQPSQVQQQPQPTIGPVMTMALHFGNIFTSKAQVLVNTVNMERYMGKGLALAIKEKWPKIMGYYLSGLKSGRLSLTKVQYVYLEEDNQWVLNFATKDRWRKPSQLDYIRSGLASFVQQAPQALAKRGIHSYAFPALGCKNGGLDWMEVYRIMVTTLASLHDLPIQIEIWEGEQKLTDEEYKAIPLMSDEEFARYRFAWQEANREATEEGDPQMASVYEEEANAILKVALARLDEPAAPTTKEQYSATVEETAVGFIKKLKSVL